MFVKFVSGPEDINEQAWPVKKFEEVEETVRELNGMDKSLIILGGKHDTPHMAIGGGKDNQYVAYITFNNKSFFRLVTTTKATKETVEIQAGDDYSDFNANQVIGLEQILTAVKHFCETGKTDPSLLWEEEVAQE